MQTELVKPLIYEFADFRVDAEKRLLWRDGRQISLTPKVFDLLLVFLERRGEVLSKENLMSLLWADSFVEESNLTQNVAVLRKVLGENPKQHKFILTVPGRGYRFVSDVREVFDKDEEAVVEEKAVENSIVEQRQGATASIVQPAIQKQNKNRLPAVFLAALALLAAGAIAFWFLGSGGRGKTDETSALTVTRTAQLTSWSGLDFFPAISADGNTIAFSSDRTGNFEIYVKQLVTGAKEIQITTDGGQNFQPAFSPDGSQIAFYSLKRGGIWIVPVMGGNPKQLTEFGSRPAFSPDGLSIAFQSDPLTDLGTDSRPAMPPSTIWIIPAKGGEAKPLTQPANPPGGHGAPSFSPNGKRIVFTNNDTINSGVWSMTTEGGDLKQVVENAWDPVYTPDGKSVLAFSGRMLLKINISERDEPVGEPVKMFMPGGARTRHLSIAQKSNRIVYGALSITSNIWSTPIAPATGEAAGNPVQYMQNINSRSIQPAFSNDGKKIAFQSVDSTGMITQVWTMDADGKNQIQLTTGGGINPRWFPDGDRIGFMTRREGQFGYWSVTVEGGKERKFFDFPQDASQARLSPDGKQVVFNSKEGETLNLWTIPIEGGKARQITFDKELAGFPAWSPDGKWLAFQIKRGENTHVAIMPGDGGEVTQLTFDKGQCWIYDWSPDNDKILFAGQRDGLWNVYWVSPSTREQKRITNFTKLNSYVRYPSWSPLNDQIAYEYAETTGNIWLIELK